MLHCHNPHTHTFTCVQIIKTCTLIVNAFETFAIYLKSMSTCLRSDVLISIRYSSHQAFAAFIPLQRTKFLHGASSGVNCKPCSSQFYLVDRQSKFTYEEYTLMYNVHVYIRSYTIDQFPAIGPGFDSHSYQEGYPGLLSTQQRT